MATKQTKTLSTAGILRNFTAADFIAEGGAPVKPQSNPKGSTPPKTQTQP